MTVTIRPVPSRVAGNRIVPFGRVQYTYKPNPVGLRDWKPPVPEPLQPAPLLGLGTLALLGLQALAWAWGQLNGRKNPGLPEWYNLPEPGTAKDHWVGQPGTYQWSVVYAGGQVDPIQGNSAVASDVKSLTTYLVSPSPGAVIPKIYLTFNNGQTLDKCAAITTAGLCNVYPEPTNPEIRVYFTPAGSSGAQLQPPSETFDPVLAAGPVVDPITPAPLVQGPGRSPLTLPTLPQPLPSTTPQTQPQPNTEPDALPAPSPLVPITPGPVAPPIVRPATPYTPQPPKLPAPTGTSNGTVIAPAPVPVPTTPQDAIFPVPGGLPVTGRTMTPTIQAVAQEVGRIEQKIDRMLNPDQGQWGDATDRLQLLWQLLSQLYNALTDGAPAGSYQLSSPCVTDENGDRVASEVEWPEQGTNHGAILARVDAIAALLQVHKDLKQPNCKGPEVPLAGEFVTVNFEQID